MADLEIRLRCTDCLTFRAFDRDAESKRVAAWAACGTRHSVDSLHAIDPDDPPAFDG